jgi:hypothetical protein
MSSKSSSRLFSTLASIERTDESATKRRRQAHLHSLDQSREASNQTKINGILLELRILTQRCLTEEAGSSATDAATASNSSAKGGRKASENNAMRDEVDAILENLLVARRDLVGHQLRDTKIDNGTSSSSDEENDDDDMHENNSDVNYAELIRNQSSTMRYHNADTFDEGGLSKQLNIEYSSLRNHWKTVLNKLHSNLTLHSGMSANTSKFQSKAVDVSFWEQVRSGMDHERFQHQTTSTSSTMMEAEENDDTSHRLLRFDDSKLYQQMLKDFISSSKSSTSGAVTHRGGMLDPAQEAAERLKRAMRKKSGGNGDVDLATLLTEEEQEYSAMKKKATTASGGAAASTSVDRRASKGRKIRYTVHPKLLNFTFPVSRPEPMISDDIWFKSLFGGVGNLR